MSQRLTFLLSAIFTLLAFNSCSFNKGAKEEGCCLSPKDVPPAQPTGVKTLAGHEFREIIYGNEGDPPILLLHSMTGPHRPTLQLAEEISKLGFRVHLPDLFVNSTIGFGKDKPFKAYHYLKGNPEWSKDGKMQEFNPDGILKDISALAAEIHRTSNQDLIVIGNCLTGIIPLALIDEPHIKAGILCQPAVPGSTPLQNLFCYLPAEKKHQLGLPPEVLKRSFTAIQQNPDKRIYGFHYHQDPVAAIERFDQLHHIFGEMNRPHQFQSYILHPADISPPEDWTDHKVSTSRRKPLSPHSTIINAATCKERKWFRDHLAEILLSLKN